MQLKEYEQYLLDNILTTQQVCDFLGIKRDAVSKMVKRGRLIPFYDQKNVRLFSLRAVQQYQETRYQRNV